MPKHEPHLTQDDLKVMTLGEFAKLNGFSLQTAKRLVADGQGPAIIQLSRKRMGVRTIDAARWSESRLRTS